MGRRLTIARNTGVLVLGDGARSWLRGLRAVAPAMGTLYVVLLLAGAGTLVGLAARHVAAAELQEASVVRVYLRQDAAAEEVDRLRRSVVAALTGDPAVDPALPTSYDPGTYVDLQRLVRTGGAAGAGLLAALALVSAAVTANAVRAAVLARQEELGTMRLLGAGRLVLSGPFVVEGALAGAAAGLLAAAILLALFAGADQVSARTFTALLPGVGWAAAMLTAAGLLAAGIALGALGALGGLRRRAS